MIRKIKEHKDKLKKNTKTLILIGLVLILAVLTLLIFRETQKFSIEDKCGKFVNLMAHTIEDESKCKTRCLGQCQSQDLDYVKIEFTKNDLSCNECICHCR